MGKVMSMVARKANRFNAENRAERVISKDKPNAAPTYPSNLKDIDRVLSYYPNLVDELNTKDAKLNDRLKQVYVERTDKPEPAAESNKQLPFDRQTPEDFEYGFKEPAIQSVTPGKCTLRQAMQFITDFQTEPEKWDATTIAEHYRMELKDVENILKHFKAFQLHIPPEGGKRQLLVEPTLSQKFLEQKN